MNFAASSRSSSAATNSDAGIIEARKLRIKAHLQFYKNDNIEWFDFDSVADFWKARSVDERYGPEFPQVFRICCGLTPSSATLEADFSNAELPSNRASMGLQIFDMQLMMRVNKKSLPLKAQLDSIKEIKASDVQRTLARRFVVV